MSAASFRLQPCSYEVVARLQRELGCSETLAWVLARRGIDDPAVARVIIDEPAPDGVADPRFHDPFLLGDMAAAVERIRFAIAERQPIVVHGDYDADGVCATTLLTEALEALGADVRPFLPNRFSNGYGLKLDSVERFALDGARLIIAVDCGITAVEEVAQALAHGIDVIVCDHHQPGERLPDAILCSTRPGDYPFPYLCATAVVGKLAQALGAPYGDAQHELEAIATIADCMPLEGENRLLVRRGLAALRRTARPGLRALLSTCDVHPREVDEQHVAFRIAPRLNAVGRMSESERAYELLRAGADSAAAMAALLHETNAERRRVEEGIVAEALAQVESWPARWRDARAYVVSGEGWHEGVVGIVASRLVERFHRPVVVIGEQQPLSRGSGRSIDGYDLHGGLAACADLLVHWGGHRAAAGLTIEPDRIPELRERLAAHANDALAPEDLSPVAGVDAVVAPDELSLALVEELDQLAPFGTGNERPRLLLVGAQVGQLRGVGDGRHLKLTLTTGGISAGAIAFGQGPLLATLRDGDRVDACVRVSVNRFRGAESLQLEVSHLMPLPDWAPRVAGMCQTPCDLTCTGRMPVEQVLARASAPSPLASVDREKPLRLEPLLARRGTIDLRHAGRALAHIARLATAGANVLVVCADVSRRRAMLRGPLHPDRLHVGSAVLASGRCNPLGIGARLHRAAATPGSHLVLCDYAALAVVLSGPLAFDAIVVLDPPVTEAQRDQLVDAGPPLHLVFGAADVRFAYDAAAAVADVRRTLGNAWRQLRDAGGTLGGADLDAALSGDGPHLNAPEAIAHGLHELEQRGLIRLVEGEIATCEAAAPAS